MILTIRRGTLRYLKEKPLALGLDSSARPAWAKDNSRGTLGKLGPARAAQLGVDQLEVPPGQERENQRGLEVTLWPDQAILDKQHGLEVTPH